MSDPAIAFGEQGAESPGVTSAARHLVVTRASEIEIRPVHWTWEKRIAAGTLALLAGREGIGKSTIAYALVADLTRGTLTGAHEGKPRNVVIAASEDSWAHTVVPRLMAAGADLERVLRVEVSTSEGFTSQVSMPRDIDALEALMVEEKVALLLLDPLISRLDSKLDTHRDAEVRLGLEPLVRIADATGAAILGLIHVSKANSTDPLNLVMGSRAFSAVARSVLFAVADPDEEGLFHLGLPKNNLGPTNLPTLDYRIEALRVADSVEGPVFSTRIDWAGQSERNVRELLEAAGETSGASTTVQEAADWLHDYLTKVGGESASSVVKEEGRRYGFSADALKRARQRLKIEAIPRGFPRETFWRLRPPSVNL